MFKIYSELFNIINFQIFLFSVLLFFMGYALAPTAYYKKVKWLTAYPFFIIKLIEKHFNQDWHPMKIFIVLLMLNSVSLFLNLLSAYAVFLPLIFGVYLGLNLGIVMYHTLKGKYYFISLINPVAIIELPAAWLSFTMALQFCATHYFNIDGIAVVSFSQYFFYFLISVIPLLIFAGIIETGLIVISKKIEKEEKDKNEK